MRGGPHMGGGGFPFLPLLGGLLSLLVLAALAFAVFRLLQNKKVGPPNFMQPPAQPSAVDPLTLLDERLAKGDIDVEDYRARRSALLDGGLSSRGAPHPEPPAS